MRTTIDLPDDLFRQVKARAALDGLKLKELITRYLQQGLREESPASPEPLRNRRDLPIAQRATGHPLPALTNAELYEILDEEDADRILGRPEARRGGDA